MLQIVNNARYVGQTDAREHFFYQKITTIQFPFKKMSDSLTSDLLSAARSLQIQSSSTNSTVTYNQSKCADYLLQIFKTYICSSKGQTE